MYFSFELEGPLTTQLTCNIDMCFSKKNLIISNRARSSFQADTLVRESRDMALRV